MSVLSSFTIAVHTFGRLTSNCTICAAGKCCHAQDDSNCHYPWPSLDRLHSLADVETRTQRTETGLLAFERKMLTVRSICISALVPGRLRMLDDGRIGVGAGCCQRNRDLLVRHKPRAAKHIARDREP